MKKKSLYVISFCIYVWGSMASTSTAQDIVRAKIGMQLRSTDDSRWAETGEDVTVGDTFRIYVLPESEAADIYVVYIDRTEKRVLTQQHVKITQGEAAILPSKNEMSAIEGGGRLQRLTIIYSPLKVPEFDLQFNAQEMSYSQWLKVEEQLIAQSKIDLRSSVEKPWEMAATVRDDDDDAIFKYRLQQALPTFSGKSFVVRKYEFRVKK